MADENDGSMSFLEHLEVLRWHLVRAFLAITLMAVFCFLAKSFIFDTVIFGPKSPGFITYTWFCKISSALSSSGIFCISEMPFQIMNTKMAGQFSTHIWVSLIGGFVLAFPYVLYEFWRFISPGLRSNERAYSRWILFFGGVLFALGVVFGYYLIVPLSLQFLGGYSISAEVSNLIDLGSYISTVSMVTLATGLIFELPVVVYFLARSGLITPQWMRTYRRHAIVSILVLAAIITPPDVASQVLVAVPISLLYELSIVVCKRVVQKREENIKGLTK